VIGFETIKGGEEEVGLCRFDGGLEGDDPVLRFNFIQARVSSRWR
jgi:hypothetical protein